MQVGRILHFSPDDFHRTTVLEKAGYTVIECRTIPDLIHMLRTEEELDAICISETTKPAEGPLAAVRAYTQAPVVLFRSSYMTYVQPTWKLEFPPLTEPRTWLPAIHDLVGRSRLHVPTSGKIEADLKRLQEKVTRSRVETEKLRTRLKRDGLDRPELT